MAHLSILAAHRFWRRRRCQLSRAHVQSCTHVPYVHTHDLRTYRTVSAIMPMPAMHHTCTIGTLCLFCNPSCSTDSYSTAYVETPTRQSHHSQNECGVGLSDTVSWVVKWPSVAKKVAKKLVPLQPGPRFATDPIDSKPSNA